MDMEQLADLLLSQSCSNPSNEHPGWNEYRIELHCATVTVTAQPMIQNGKWAILKADCVDS